MSAAELKRIRELPCALAESTERGAGWTDACAGPTDAHHRTGAGLALKANDRETFPLCHKHHMDFHSGRGIFRDWKRETRKTWQQAMIDRYWPDDVDGKGCPF